MPSSWNSFVKWTRRRVSNRSDEDLASDLRKELIRASELLEANIDLPGHNMDARSFKEIIDPMIDQLEAGQPIDKKKLWVVFTPTGDWDDISVQMSRSDNQIAQDVANKICHLCR